MTARNIVKKTLGIIAAVMFLIAFGSCGGLENGNFTLSAGFTLISVFSVLGFDFAWLAWRL